MSNNPYQSPEAADNPVQPGQKARSVLFNLLIGGAVLAILMALLLPLRRNAREAARQTQCRNNLKQIMLALHTYHDEYHSFPPAWTVDTSGRPLHSWRTLILPYLEQQALYDSIDLTKPWNDPANSKAIATRISTYHCPSTVLPPGFTTYLAVAGPDSFFDSSRTKTIAEIVDGTSNTLAVIEVSPGDAVHWMAPHDADEPLLMQMVGKYSSANRSHEGGTHAALADGSVRFLAENLSVDVLKALMTASGGDKLEPHQF